jgi:hypothetical protein
MLTDSSSELQVAITAALMADPEIIALVADRIYDRIPDGRVFPYIVFGDTQILPDLSEGTDATLAYVTIHTWDRFQGFDAIKSVGKRVVAVLHDQPLAITGSVVQSILLDSSRYLRDPDGLTSHFVATFSILTDANIQP